MARLNITFSPQAFEDYKYFQQNDKKMVKKINELLKSIDRNGALEGIGTVSYTHLRAHET